MPDIVQTSLESVKMLKFFLPAIALHIKSDLIIEVSVDYRYTDERHYASSKCMGTPKR